MIPCERVHLSILLKRTLTMEIIKKYSILLLDSETCFETLSLNGKYLSSNPLIALNVNSNVADVFLCDF